jgi:hypothetical protein
MNQLANKRKRFVKHSDYLVNRNIKLSQLLKDIFQTYHAVDFCNGLNHWQRMALSNDQSSYDEGYMREDLMDLVDQLKQLINCWWSMYLKRVRKDKPAENKLGAVSKSRNKNEVFNAILDDADSRPGAFLKIFCETFNRSYIELELLDMLDAVINYEGPNPKYKGNLVYFYQHLICLVRLTYRINKNKLSATK